MYKKKMYHVSIKRVDILMKTGKTRENINAKILRKTAKITAFKVATYFKECFGSVDGESDYSLRAFRANRTIIGVL